MCKNIETNKEFYIKKEGKCSNCNEEQLMQDNPKIDIDVDYDYDSIIFCKNCGYWCIRLYNEITEGYFK